MTIDDIRGRRERQRRAVERRNSDGSTSVGTCLPQAFLSDTADVDVLLSALDAARAVNVRLRQNARLHQTIMRGITNTNQGLASDNEHLSARVSELEAEGARQRHTIGRLVAAMYQAYAASLDGDEDPARAALWDGVHDNGLTWANAIQEGANDE